MKVSAQLVRLLCKNDLMASIGCSDCCLHSRRASPCDQDFLLLPRRLLWQFCCQLLSHGRVYSALNHLQLARSAKALVTSQARGNIIRAAIVCLLRQIWICKACPPQFHYIRLSGLNDLFHLGRIIQRAYAGHGRLHMLLNLCGQIHIYPSFIEGGWMSAAEHIRIFVVSTGYINQIHFVVDHPGYFDALLKPEPFIGHVITGYPGFDRESRAYCIPYSVQGQQEESCPVFKRSAELICASVPHRRQEL